MNVMVGIDGRAPQRDALALAAQLARVEGGRMTIVHVYPWSRWSVRLGAAYEMTMREMAEALLVDARLSAGDVPCAIRAVADLSPARGLHRVAVEEDADILVVGASHRSAVGRTVLGGVGDRVIHAAPCGLAVAPHGYGDAKHVIRRVGVAYDGSAEATDALRWAGRFAESVGATVTVFSVFEPPISTVGYGVTIPYDLHELEEPMREECRQRLDSAVASLPVAVAAEGVMLHGAPAHVLATATTDVDLLVAGSRGYGPVRTTVLGSVSRSLIHHSQRPVIVLPRGAHTDAELADVAAAVTV